MKTAPGLIPRGELRQTLRTGLIPCIWQEANLLHLSPHELLEELRRIASNLPLEVRAPRASVQYDDARPHADAPSVDAVVGHQISLCPDLEGPLADGAAWCELLDARGYLNCAPREAAAALMVTEQAFVQALPLVQNWVEPVGLFARDLADSLMIQLARSGMRASDAAFLLKNGREMLEQGRSGEFAVAHGWSEKRLEAALGVLRSLDPNPGGAFAISREVVPELEFTSADGVVRCRVMTENLPTLETIDGMPELPNSFASQVRSVLLRLEGRERTLARIGMFLAEHQARYLSGAATTPRPLGLEEVSRATGLHTSTVSRVLSTHWARSDVLGVFRLSSLLLRSIGGAGGRGGIDYAYLERTIRQAQEELLTDAEIADFLGIPRRTVAYHRLRLGLPPVTKARKGVTISQKGCENRTRTASA